MSRTAITLGFPHGSGDPVIISGPQVPIHAQRDALKRRLMKGADPKFARVEIWFSQSAVRGRFEKTQKARDARAIGVMPAAKAAPVAPPEPTKNPEEKPPTE